MPWTVMFEFFFFFFIKVNSLNAEAGKLMENHPMSADSIETKLNELTETWRKLKENAGQRKNKLNESYVFQKFLSDYRYAAAYEYSIYYCLAYFMLSADL